MTANTQTKRKTKIKLDLDKINQKAQELSDGHSKCELPVIPLYPVRYGLSLGYLADARDGTVKNLPDRAPRTIGASPDYELMQLRQGFVYIYAHTKHRLFSTDDKGKWLVFRYVTNNDDANSASDFEQLSHGKNAGLNACFLLCKWGEEGANGNWTLGQIDTKNYPCASHLKSFNTAFVDKDVDIVDIAYSEYMWSSEIIHLLETKAALRQAIMTTVRTDAPENHSAPLKSLGTHVLEYQSGNQSDDFADKTQDWYTKLNSAAIPSPLTGLPDYEEKGLMVALQDVVGEMHELQKIIIDLTEKQKAYYARYAYPIAIGNIIDPKIGFDVRGKTYPFKEKERVIAQKGVQGALISEFNSKMTALLNVPFERYEKPINALVKQVTNLANQRASFREFFKVSGDIGRYVPKEGCIDRGFYVFYRLLADFTYGLECSSDGIAVLESLFSEHAAPAGKVPTTVGWLKEHSKKVTDAVYGMAMKIPARQRQNLLKGYFQAMEHVYLNSGRTMANLVALRKTQFDKVMAIYGWDEARLVKNADYFFAEVADKFLDRLMKQDSSRQYKKERHETGRGKKAIRQELKQIKQTLKEQNRITLDEIRDLEARIQLSERYYGFTGVLAIYAGMLSLNNDLTVPRKLVRTAAGRLALDPVMVKTADTAYALGLMGKPGAGIGALRNLAGASARSVLVGVRALAYTGMVVDGGVLTAVIAFGGLQEAIVNEDNVSIVANGAIIASSSVLVLSGIVAMVSKGTLASTLGAANPYALVIVLLGFAAIALFGSTPLETWVKKGFWGRKAYFYWNEKRDDVNNQIKRAEILANENIAEIAKQYLARLELVTTGQVDAVAGAGLPMNEQVEDYILISQGFEKELYEYDIQSGLKINKISRDYYRISCAEFRRTEPTTQNLVINLYQWGLAQAQPIKRFYAAASGEVTFYLAENNIHIEDIRIVAEFTDKEGDTFTDVYLSEEFNHRTRELEQRMQKAVEDARDEGYSE
ncbi:hypothetical protein FXB68_11140 [Aggregatibacter actinomycetemcomitans]|uniref:toxin VasX n=1 Tax=Aggregatibacter actinomycetemcomitans TaxID=714 RepID=UPI0011DA1883|nr:toxin VasX [Aggregatibacter actinomycetemcomitans]TYA33933.1 hypothetical protein FXB68_11140 [Aggregatibacter actinomycetemcomitans]